MHIGIKGVELDAAPGGVGHTPGAPEGKMNRRTWFGIIAGLFAGFRLKPKGFNVRDKYCWVTKTYTKDGIRLLYDGCHEIYIPNIHWYGQIPIVKVEYVTPPLVNRT